MFVEHASTPNARAAWVVLGVLLGLGLQNKISVLWLGGRTRGGLVLTPARRLLLTPGPWSRERLPA